MCVGRSRLRPYPTRTRISLWGFCARRSSSWPCDAAIIDGADAAIIDGADAAIIDGAAIDSGADARPVDAPIDANLSGLGQLCTLNEECPAEAPTCLDFGVHAMLGYCTRVCHDDWMATTDNQGTFPAGSFNLPPSDSDLCRASFSGSSGVALCGVATDVRPMIVTLPAPDTTYTMDYTCIITCGSGAACPAGLVANTNVVPSGCVCVPWR